MNRLKLPVRSVLAVTGVALLATATAQTLEPVFGISMDPQFLLMIGLTGASAHAAIQSAKTPPRTLRRILASVIASVPIGGSVAGLIVFWLKWPPAVMYMLSILMISVGYEEIWNVVKPVIPAVIERLTGLKAAAPAAPEPAAPEPDPVPVSSEVQQ